MPSPILYNRTPYTCLFREEPNYLKLRVFGCLCYPWLRPYSTHKLTPRSLPYVFLGYSLTQSAYLCLNPSTSPVFISRHVEFQEHEFPFARLNSAPSSLTSDSGSLSSPASSSTSLTSFFRIPLETTSPAPPLSPNLVPETSPTEPPSPTSSPVPIDTTSLPSPSPPSSPPQRMTTRSMNNIHKPNPRYGLLAILSEIEPATIIQALKDKKWRDSTSAEYNSLIGNFKWDLVPPDKA